jgi:putative DNA primase/helicase
MAARLIGPWTVKTEDFTLEAGVMKAAGNNRVEVTGIVGGQPVHLDRIVLSSADERTKFAKAMAGHVSTDSRQAIDNSLIALSGEIRKDVLNAQAQASADEAEADGREGPHQGRLLEFADVDPWPDQVDGGELLDDIVATIKRYAILPDGAAEAIALWVVHTYTMDSWWVSPFLTIHSPLKRCGKSTVLKIAAALVHRPISTANITPAALFRVVEKYKPTMLFDEAQEWIDIPNSELRAILNAGHYREGAKTFRCEGDDQNVVSFSTWAPKLIALVGNLPDMMMDRSIVVSMRRKRSDERVDRMNGHTFDRLLLPLRRRCVRFVADNAEDFEQPEHFDGISSDRAIDNWSPLLTIARTAGERWLAAARAVAVQMSDGEEVGDESPGLALLADIRAVFDDLGATFVPSKTIVETLNKLEERPWGERRRGQGISASWLTKQLKPYIAPPPKRERLEIGGERKQMRGYSRDWFHDAWARYLRPEASQCHNVNSDGPKRDVSVAEAGKPVTLTKVGDLSNSSTTTGCVTPVTHAGLFSAPRSTQGRGNDDAERF